MTGEYSGEYSGLRSWTSRHSSTALRSRVSGLGLALQELSGVDMRVGAVGKINETKCVETIEITIHEMWQGGCKLR